MSLDAQLLKFYPKIFPFFLATLTCPYKYVGTEPTLLPTDQLTSVFFRLNFTHWKVDSALGLEVFQKRWRPDKRHEYLFDSQAKLVKQLG